MNSHHLLSGLLGTSVQGGLVVVAVLAVQAVLGRRLKPRWRCLLWLVVVLRLLLPASVGVRWSVFNAPGLRDWLRDVRTTQAATVPVPAPPAPALAEAPSEFGSSIDRPAGVVALATPEAGPAESAGAVAHFAWPSLFVLAAWLWVAGLVAFMAQVTVRSLRWRREFKGATPVSDRVILDLAREAAWEMGIRRPPPVFENGTVAAPVLYGIAHPRLMLPRGFASQYAREEIRFIVFHELIHLKRHDLVVNGLATVLQAIHWFNPLIWLGFSRLRLDRELACDAEVLERLGAVRRQRYGETIIRLMEGRRLLPLTPGHVGAVEAPAHLQQRIAMITDFEPASKLSALGLLLVACVGALCLTDAPARLSPSVTARPFAGTLSRGGLALPMPLHLPSHPLTVEGEPTPAFDSILGRHTFDGLPFDIRGQEKLFGKYAEDRVRGNRRQEFSVPVGAAFGELHVIHAAAWWADPDGTPIAIIRLLYGDGGHHDFTVSYGIQVRDVWQTDYEQDESLADPNSKLIFRGPGDPSIPGSSLRLFKSVFRNPRPGVPVTAILFISAGNQSCYELVAATVASADAGRPVTPPVPLASPALPPDASLGIRVVDKGTGRTLVGAFVTVSPVQLALCKATGLRVTADAPVNYRYPSARRDRFLIDATCPGYVGVRREWNPEAGSQLTLALAPGVRLQGRVVNSAGKPVAGATVVEGFAYEDLWRMQRKFSDTSGTFSFEGLPTGQNFLAVSAPGFAPTFQQMDMERAVYEVERLVPGRLVRGRVVDVSGRGIAGARVQFAHGESVAEDRLISHTLRWHAQTDKNGGFKWNDAPAGRLYLSVVKEGYMTLQDAAFPEGTGILTMLPPLTIHGNVLDAATGKPVAGFRLKVGHFAADGAPAWLPGRKDFHGPDGSYVYSITEPPFSAATYAFGIEAPGYRTFVSKPIDFRSGTVPLEVSLNRMP